MYSPKCMYMCMSSLTCDQAHFQQLNPLTVEILFHHKNNSDNNRLVRTLCHVLHCLNLSEQELTLYY